jgi:hypothetical protein
MMNEVVADQIQYYGKIWFSRLSLVVAILLILPTTAILATWNTLPNEPLYPVKRYLENIALKLVGNSFAARADLQATFVEQRFNEAEVLLIQSSNDGLEGLTMQIKVAKAEIVSARVSSDVKLAASAEKKAEKLVTQLKEYDQKLEQKKVSPIIPTPNPKPSPTVNPSVEEIQEKTAIATAESVQEVIQETIKELENANAVVKNEELQSPKPSESPKSDEKKEIKKNDDEVKDKSKKDEVKIEDNKEVKKEDKDN